jgi:hypothetical protein
LVLHHHRVRMQKCQSQVTAGRLPTSFLTNTSNQRPTVGNAAGPLLITDLTLRLASVTGHALQVSHRSRSHLHEETPHLTKLSQAGAQAAGSLKDTTPPTDTTKKIIMTVTDAVGNISHFTSIHIAAEMAKGLGVILAVTVAGRIAGMTADTIAAMAGQEVAARISAFRDNILILKLTDTDDLTKVIIAEAGAGTGTGEAETKIAEADKKSRQIRHLTMLC